MQCKIPFAWFVVLLIILISVSLLAYQQDFRGYGGENGKRTARNQKANQSAETVMELKPITQPPPVFANDAFQKFPGELFHIYDQSLGAKNLLFSKGQLQKQNAESDAAAGADLWLLHAGGRKRLISTNAVQAGFSPDGNHLAYATAECELFIESFDGRQLARIPRARDPSWQADSLSVTFFVVPSLDYPELLQSMTYDLVSGQMTRSIAVGVLQN